jgi:hypothetical protein
MLTPMACYAAITEAIGERREAKPRGRPKGSVKSGAADDQPPLELPND